MKEKVQRWGLQRETTGVPEQELENWGEGTRWEMTVTLVTEHGDQTVMSHTQTASVSPTVFV